MKVLLVGNGGREHALAWGLAQSPHLGALMIAPGNPGTAMLGQNVPIQADDVPGLTELARREHIDLVVVGPEVALAAGIADALAPLGIPCFGPTAAAATIESSKGAAKALMVEAGIPTAGYQVFETAQAALRFLAGEDWASWRVVKADGLHAGKGVIVAESRAELEAAIRQLGSSGEPLILEEPLEGPEVSLLAFSDGRHAACMPLAQDHKRIGEQDRGPNTGGMGAYAPVPLDAMLTARLGSLVIDPALAALAARGTPFVGVLYAGLMLTTAGPRVIEYNARWGDPETQALVPLLKTDLLAVVRDCVAGRLDPAQIHWHPGAALGVVLAAANYPETPRRGDLIRLPDVPEHTHIFHAGTAIRDGALVTAGGRVLTVVGTGETLKDASARAYACAEQIQFDGRQMRRDIGWRALGRDIHGS
jgi:phosphoribosylamine--glycine ligase